MWSDFHFVRPWWLLLLLPLAWLLWRQLQGRSDSGIWRGVVDAHLLTRLLDRSGDPASRMPLALLGAGWLLAVLALAGPAWERLPQPLFQAQHFRVVALDLSLPMNVADVKPSRLAQARFKVIDLLHQVGEGQTALIAFGAEPYVVSPLTGDAATIVAQVPLLETALLPVTGPARADLALRKAGELLQQAGAPGGEVILVSNAIREQQRSVAVAQELSGAGFRVSVLGVGTPDGAPLPLPGGGFVQDPTGGFVISRLEPDALARIAEAGGGRFVESTPGSFDIDQLIPDEALRFVDPALQQGGQTAQWREEGPWLLLVLLPLAALAFRRGWLSPPVVLLGAACLLPVPEVQALTWDELWSRDDQRAMRSLERGDATRAAELFEQPDWRAAAAYEGGDYAQALALLERPEAANAAYNSGNTLAHLGRLEEAIEAYDEALQANPDDEDAQHNRDLLRRLLLQREQQEEPRPESPREDETQPDPEAEDAAQQESEAQESAEQESQQSESAQQDAQAEQQDEQGEQDSAQQGEAAQGEQSAEASQAEVSPDAESSEAEQQGEEQQAGEAADGDEGEQQAEADQEGQTGEQASDGQGEQAGQQASAGQEQAEGEVADNEGGSDDATGSDAAQQTGDALAGTEQTEAQQEPDQQAQTPGPDGDEARPDADGQGDDAGEEQTASTDAGDQGPDNQDNGTGAQAGEPDAGSGDEGPGEQQAATDDQQPGAAEEDAAVEAPEQETTAAGPPAPRPEPGQTPDRSDLLGGEPPVAGGPAAPTDPTRVTGGDVETAQALEQMLRRVDEDPGGLLRQRFMLQHLRRSGQLP